VVRDDPQRVVIGPLRRDQVPGEPAESAQPLQQQRCPPRLFFRIDAGEHALDEFLGAGVVAGRGRGLGGAF
jgi:hypothetical protein